MPEDSNLHSHHHEKLTLTYFKLKNVIWFPHYPKFQANSSDISAPTNYILLL
jgi:hypothetical protein